MGTVRVRQGDTVSGRLSRQIDIAMAIYRAKCAALDAGHSVEEVERWEWVVEEDTPRLSSGEDEP